MSLHRFIVLALALFCWLGAAHAEEAAPQPHIEYPASSEFVVLELTGTGTLITDTEQRPFVRIHGDGRVHVRRPSYVRLDPGDFEAYLSHSDLRSLLSLCASKGLMEFDRQAVEDEHEAEARDRLQTTGSVPGVADAGYTILQIQLAEYAPAGSEVVTEGVQKRISWRALSDVVSWYPGIEALARFQEFVDVLESIQDATIEASKRDEISIFLPPVP